MGGWLEATFERGGFKGAIFDLWAPYVRTTFIKVTLRFPDQGAPLAVKRAFQMQVLQGASRHLGP